MNSLRTDGFKKFFVSGCVTCLRKNYGGEKISGGKAKNCTSRSLWSHMRFRKISSIINGSIVRDLVSCAFLKSISRSEQIYGLLRTRIFEKL